MKAEIRRGDPELIVIMSTDEAKFWLAYLSEQRVAQEELTVVGKTIELPPEPEKIATKRGEMFAALDALLTEAKG